jgi:Trp operon repressor
MLETWNDFLILVRVYIYYFDISHTLGELMVPNYIDSVKRVTQVVEEALLKMNLKVRRIQQTQGNVGVHMATILDKN